MTESIDGHIQDDPALNEMADIYSTIGGELPVRVFSSISQGVSMNELAEDLIDSDGRSWHEEKNMDMFLLQAQDILEDFEQKNLIQQANNNWRVTSYGKQWKNQMDSARGLLLDLLNEDIIGYTGIEDDSKVDYRGEETLGDFYQALGFNMSQETSPEALPVLHILGGNLNDGEVPRDYEDGAEQLGIIGMIEDADYDGKESLNPVLTEVGQRIYEDVVLEDREFVEDHYGLN